jgi:hypothetical protein
MSKIIVFICLIFIAGLSIWLHFGSLNDPTEDAYNIVQPIDKSTRKLTTIENVVTDSGFYVEDTDEIEVKSQPEITKNEVKSPENELLVRADDLDEISRRKEVFTSFLDNYASFTTNDFFGVFEYSKYSVHIEMLNELIICHKLTPGCKNELTSVARLAVSNLQDAPSKVICSDKICYIEEKVPYIIELRKNSIFNAFIKPPELIKRDPHINYTNKTNQNHDRFVTLIEICPDPMCQSFRNN